MIYNHPLTASNHGHLIRPLHGSVLPLVKVSSIGLFPNDTRLGHQVGKWHFNLLEVAVSRLEVQEAWHILCCGMY